MGKIRPVTALKVPVAAKKFPVIGNNRKVPITPCKPLNYRGKSDEARTSIIRFALKTGQYDENSLFLPC